MCRTTGDGGTDWPRKTDVQSFLLVHLFTKLGTAANDAATSLKLLEKGLSKEDLALAVLIDFPFQIIFGWMAARWSSGEKPLRPVRHFSASCKGHIGAGGRSLTDSPASKVVEGYVVSVVFRSRVYVTCRRLSFQTSLDTLFHARSGLDSPKLFR
jgi:Acetyl-coenzyme A transporter 1